MAGEGSAKRPLGRPKGSSPYYTDEIIEKIIGGLESGRMLTAICREPGMPNPRTVYDWKEEHPSFSSRFERARQIGFDAIAEEALTISNTPVLGDEEEESTTESDKGVFVSNKRKRSEMLGHRRLQVETRLKLLAIWNPARFGGKVADKDASEDGSIKITGGLPDED